MTWRATVLTCFGDVSRTARRQPCRQGLASRLWALEARDIRTRPLTDIAVSMTPRPRRAGMVLRADVLADAIDAAEIVRIGLDC